MSNTNDFKSALFRTNPNLIVKRMGEECHALLYNTNQNIFVCSGLQADLIYLLSQSFSSKTFHEIFSSMQETYEIDPLTLSHDLQVSLRRMADLELITIQFEK